MNKITLIIVHEKLINRLTDKNFLSKINVLESAMQSIMLDKFVVSKLSCIIENKKFTCEDVRNITLQVVEKLYPSNEDFTLEDVYKYIQNVSFPNINVLNRNYEFENSILIYLKILKTISLCFNKNNKKDVLSRIFNSQDNIDYEKNDIMLEKKYVDCLENCYIYEWFLLSSELYKNNYTQKIKGIYFVIDKLSNKLIERGHLINKQYLRFAAIGQFIGYLVSKSLNNYEYYVKSWFNKNGFNQIGKIAVNNNILCLLNEGLPLESIILIYANLRIGVKDKDNYFIVKRNISLNKVENIKKDSLKKLIRIKIQDFENFLINNYININTFEESLPINDNYLELLSGEDLIYYIKNISLDYKYKLINIINNNDKFQYILEEFKNCNKNSDLQIYINVFVKYGQYLDKDNKNKLLEILYNILGQEGVINKYKISMLLGKTIALYDNYISNITNNATIDECCKIFDLYIEKILLDDNLIASGDQIFCFSMFIKEFFTYVDESKIQDCIQCLLKYFGKLSDRNNSVFALIYAFKSIDFNLYIESQIKLLFNYIVFYLKQCNKTIIFALLDFISNAIFSNTITNDIKIEIKKSVEKLDFIDNISIEYLKFKILLNVSYNKELKDKYIEFMLRSKSNISELFLNNLKLATPWYEKIVNIDFLSELLKDASNISILHVATHLCNLLKVSAIEVVRKKAGSMLLDIEKLMTIDQRNEICVELLKGLEISELDCANNIPNFLAKFSLMLHPKELDEMIGEFYNTYKCNKDDVRILILKTITIIINNYSIYETNFTEDFNNYDKRLDRLLGILVKGIISKSNKVSNFAFKYISIDIFNSIIVVDNDKLRIFNKIIKKVVNLIDYNSRDNFELLNRSLCFDYIYDFITNYSLEHGNIVVSQPEKIAFFSDSFNDFNTSYDELIDKVLDLDYELYIYISEFNWKNKLLPFKERQDIAFQKTASNFNVFVFPSCFPINIANPKDVKKLIKIFKNKDLYLVLNYNQIAQNLVNKQRQHKNALYNCNYILHNRNSMDNNINIESIIDKINGNVVELNLNKSYREDVIYKSVGYKRKFKVDIIEDISKNIVDEIGRYIFMYTDLYKNIGEELDNKNISLLVIRENNNNDKIVGFSAFHKISLADVFKEFKNLDIANYVRKNTSGKIVIIDGMYNIPYEEGNSLEQILLMETLSYCLKNDFTYAIYHNTLLDYDSKNVHEVLKLYGFNKLNCCDNDKDIYCVDMKFPICLTLDIENLINKEFLKSSRIRSIIEETRNKIKLYLTKLFPGSLIMSFDVSMLQNSLVNQVCSINKVSSDDLFNNNELGKYICVPYGNIFNGKYIPNTVTKSLHLEKFYNYNLREYKILNSRNCLDITTQLKTIKSYNRPVILVDDILHYGDELNYLDSLLKNNDVSVEKIVVSILSSNGKDLMDMHDRHVECEYFVPNLRLWLKESRLYPFIGGYSILTDNDMNYDLIPSVNNILPYQSPNFMEGANKKLVYNFSMLCLQSTKELFHTIEYEYEKRYGKELKIKDLKYVINYPRIPSKGKYISYNLNKKVSYYLENEIQDLERLEKVIKY